MRRLYTYYGDPELLDHLYAPAPAVILSRAVRRQTAHMDRQELPERQRPPPDLRPAADRTHSLADTAHQSAREARQDARATRERATQLRRAAAEGRRRVESLLKQLRDRESKP
jgi:hypothetical protein